jgi:DNA-binding CsgD family transcriptional regulator
LVQQAINLGKRLPEPVVCLSGYLAQCRICIARDNFNDAVKISRLAKNRAQGLSRKYSFLVDVFLSYLSIRLGNYQTAADLAREWAASQKYQASIYEQNNQVWDDIRDMWWESPYVTLFRIHSLQKLAGEFSIKWGDPGQHFGESKSFLHRMELSIIHAIHLYSTNRVDEALVALQEVLVETEREGIVRIYLDEGEPMLGLLRIAKSKGFTPHYIKKLIHAFTLSKKGAIDAGPDNLVEKLAPSQITILPNELIEPLSKREIEVLQLLQLGLSNREISEKLVITLSTVKNHTSNIYQKLEVNSRGKAIQRAVELGYL